MVAVARHVHGAEAAAEVNGVEIVTHLVGAVAAVGGVAEAELAAVVVAPALHRVVIEQGAGVVLPGGDLHRSAAGAEIDGEQAGPHLVGVVASAGGVTVAEVAVAVVAPALHRAAAEQGAGVVGAQGHGLHRGPGAEIDGGQAGPHLVGAVAAVGGVAEAELAVIVEPPALHRAAGQPAAGVIAADPEAAHVAAEIGVSEAVPHLVATVAALGGVALAEVAVAVVAPALHPIVVQQSAGVRGAEGDVAGGAASAEVDGGEAVAHLVGAVAGVAGVAEAELAVVVTAPALQAVIIQDRAGVVAPGDEPLHRAAGAQIDGLEAAVHLLRLAASGGGVALAEVAVAVVAPALHRPVIQDRAGLLIAQREGGGGVALAEIDEGQAVADLVGVVAPLGGVAEAELTAAVGAPALHPAVGEPGAGVLAPGLHLSDAQRIAQGVGAQICVGEAVAELVGAVADGGAVAEAELAAVVAAPALHLVVVEHRAHVVAVGVGLRHGAAGAQIHVFDGAEPLRGRGAAGGGVALTEVAVAVVAPALHRPVIQDRAGELAAHLHVGAGAAGAQRHRGEVVAHLVGAVAALGGVALAEVAVAVIAPALHRAVVEGGAAVVLPHGHVHGRPIGAEIGRGEAGPHLVGAVADVAGVADAELAVAVVAPALQAAVIQDRAGVAVADLHRGDGAAEIEIGEGAVHLRGLSAAVGGVALAEVAVAVVAPALHRAVVEQGAAEVSADLHIGGGVAGAQIGVGEVVAHLVGAVAALGGVALAELAIAVVAPALHLAIIKHRAGVDPARGHVSDGVRLPLTVEAEIDGGHPITDLVGAVADVAGVAEAELAVAVVTPAL